MPLFSSQTGTGKDAKTTRVRVRDQPLVIARPQARTVEEAIINALSTNSVQSVPQFTGQQLSGIGGLGTLATPIEQLFSQVDQRPVTNDRGVTLIPPVVQRFEQDGSPSGPATVPGTRQTGGDTEIVTRGNATVSTRPATRVDQQSEQTTNVASDIGGLLAFRESLKIQESGGDYGIVGPVNDGGRGSGFGAYQFLDGTWRDWAAISGIGTQYSSAAQAPPEIQDAQATFAMTRLWRRYNDWRLVAIAWHAGQGVADRVARQGGQAGTSDGFKSTDLYAQEVLERAGLG